MRWVRAAVRSWARPCNAGAGRKQPTGRIGDDLHVLAVPAVLVGVVGSSVAEPVALDERAVQQDGVRVDFAQDLRQTR